MAGNITGTVIDIRTNQPLYGAAVSAGNGSSASATTGDDGSYSLSLAENLSPGYNLDVKATGYDEFLAEGIVVVTDVTTTIKVALQPSEG